MPYAVRVRATLANNEGHRGVQLAVAEIEALLADALRRHSAQERMSPDYLLWLDLAQRGVSGHSILSMVFGVIAYERLDGDAALNELAYQHRVARAVMALGARKGRTSGGTPKDLPATGQRMLGRFLLERYSALAVGVVDAIKTTDRKAQERRALLTMPLR